MTHLDSITENSWNFARSGVRPEYPKIKGSLSLNSMNENFLDRIYWINRIFNADFNEIMKRIFPLCDLCLVLSPANGGRRLCKR